MAVCIGKCDYMGSAGRIKEAGESLLDIVNTVDRDAYMTGPVITWVSGKSCYPVVALCIRSFATDFLQQYLSTPESSADTAFRSPSPTPLLTEWAKSKLTSGSWRDALVASLNVSILCFGAPRWLNTLLVWSLRPRDSRFIALSATTLK